MGSRKNAEVINGTSENTAAVSAGADITVSHWRIAASDDTTAKTNWKVLKDSGGTTVTRTLSAGDFLNISDHAFYLTLGTVNSSADTFLNTGLAAMLDRSTGTGALANGDVIQWSTDGTNKTTRLASYAINWDAAADWTA